MNTNEIRLSGLGSESLSETLRYQLSLLKPGALGIASAFVSVKGIQEILTIVKSAGTLHCRLLAGISNSMTHPEALKEALEAGWVVRLGEKLPTRGIFHPKLIVAGRRFDRNAILKSPSFLYVGSSNLTFGGLRMNVECGFLSTRTACPSGVSDSFAKLWRMGRPATANRLQKYAEDFRSTNSRRSVEDLEALGIADTIETGILSYGALRQAGRVTLKPTFPSIVARAAWAGLESFTGEYRFQVEFPRAAGEVLSSLVKAHATRSSIISVFCTEDYQNRDMQYRFYFDNAMFRLNVPNDVPGVSRARRTHSGIALVEETKKRGACVQLTIFPTGEETNRVVRRSIALGTWGKTSTRLYGWY